MSSVARSRAPRRRTSRSVYRCQSATWSSPYNHQRRQPMYYATTPRLSKEQADAFGRELDAIRRHVLADLGERDADYIRDVIRAQRRLEVTGRGLLFFSFIPPAWLGGVAALSLSKVLANMEIRHKLLHGQYDWMNDPQLNGTPFEWDNPFPADHWPHFHNYLPHPYT